MLNKKQLFGPVALACAALALAACGSSGSSTASSGDAASTSECATAAKAVVDKTTADPALVMPTPAFDMTKNQGKTLWVIDILTNQFIQSYNTAFSEGAAAAGMQAKIFDGKGSVAEWNTGIRQAISQKAAGIALIGIDGATVAESVKAAKAAGIPVVDVLSGDPTAPLPDGVAAHVTQSYTENGAHLADYALADTGCKLDMGILYTPDVAVWDLLGKGAAAESKKLCPDCPVESATVNLANVATDAGRAAGTLLTQNPDMNYIFATGESFIPFMEPQVKQARPSVKIMGHDGLDAAVKEIKAGGMQVATVGFPTAWTAWLTVDNLGRLIQDLPANDVVIPNQLIDKSNAKDSNTAQFPNFADYKNEYLKVWKK
jgi:ribose transport system substrate-binding protein